MLAFQSVCLATENMILAAWAKGDGSVWLGVPLMMEKEYNELLGVPKEMKLVGALAPEYPAMKVQPTKRRLIEEVISFL